MAEIFGATVAGGEEASEVGGTRVIGNNETRLVKKEETFEITVLKNFSERREATDFDEEVGNGKDLLIFQDEGIEMIIFVDMAGENFLIIENFDIGGIFNLGNQGFFGGKMGAAMNEKNFLRNIREIGSGEKGGIATTDDSNDLILIKSAIASRTIGNTVTDKFRFIDEIEATWGGAGSENNGFGGVGLIASESEVSGGFFKMLNFVVDERKTERFQLLINLFGKFRATNFGKTRVIFNNWSFENLSTVAGIFE